MTLCWKSQNQSQRSMHYEYIWRFLEPIIALKVVYIKIKR